VWWDGRVLRVQTQTSRLWCAITGEAPREVVIRKIEIAQVRLKPAGLVRPGTLDIRTTGGHHGSVKFTRRQQPGFEGLARDLSER
jgi:hypothetical protein